MMLSGGHGKKLLCGLEAQVGDLAGCQMEFFGLQHQPWHERNNTSGPGPAPAIAQLNLALQGLQALAGNDRQQEVGRFEFEVERRQGHDCFEGQFPGILTFEHDGSGNAVGAWRQRSDRRGQADLEPNLTAARHHQIPW